MKIILTLFLIFKYNIHGYLVTCDTYSEINCQASGYCQWVSSQCRTLECHKVTDFRACSGKLNGYLYQKYLCKISTNIDPKFMNLCIEYNQNTLMWGHLVYPQDNSQKSTHISSSGLLISQIATNKYPGQFKSEILTLNILKAKKDELLNIMYGYLQQTNELCEKDIPLQFLEKAIYESAQQIRDEIDITQTQEITTQFYQALWGMTDAFFLKLRSSQINQYISYNYLINFGFAHLKMQILELEMQFELFQITWGQQIEGYIEVIIMPGEQFGYNQTYSNVIIIRLSDLNGYTIQNPQIQLKWVHQKQQTFNTNKFFKIDQDKMTLLIDSIGSCDQLSCIAQFNLQNREAYIITSTNNIACSKRSQSACRLRRCNWNYSSHTCA